MISVTVHQFENILNCLTKLRLIGPPVCCGTEHQCPAENIIKIK